MQGEREMSLGQFDRFGIDFHKFPQGKMAITLTPSIMTSTFRFCRLG